MIKLCCYVIRSTRSPEGSPRPPGSPGRGLPEGDLVDRITYNYTVLFLSRDVKNTKLNQYFPVDLTSLNVSNSRFRKPVMFWRWRRHGVALWRLGRGAWHNCLLLATASDVNCWADVANHLTWLWQAGSRASYGPYHGLELPNHGIKLETDRTARCTTMVVRSTIGHAMSCRFTWLTVW